MGSKKCTLYFNGVNKYGHEHKLPILTRDIKSIDRFICNYNDYIDLFNNLPVEVKSFIENEISYKINVNSKKDLKQAFCIMDGTNSFTYDFLFKKDEDVVFATMKELLNHLEKKQMNLLEIQDALLKTKVSDDIAKRYNFFKYLYSEFVKDKKICCMLDSYEIEDMLPNLSKDNTMIASIATDKSNLIVLCKKISQSSENKRKLTLKYKETFKDEYLEDDFIINEDTVQSRKNIDIDITQIKDEILKNYSKFLEEYNEEYS